MSLHDFTAKWVDLFDRDVESRLVMAIARRAGLTYTEVRERWSQEDIAREMAYDMYLNAQAMERCRDCGTNPEEIVDDDGLPLENGYYKLYKTDCPTCRHLKENTEKLSEREKADGVRYELRLREPGDSWVDNGPEFGSVKG